MPHKSCTYANGLGSNIRSRFQIECGVRSAAIAAAVLMVAVFLLGCGTGGMISSPAGQSSSPSGLSYSQASIMASVGQAITPDTPTATGTVTAYSVAPALPAGLSLNTSTGVISGTPTAASQQAAYTVTAAEAGGNLTATIQIAVAGASVAAPSKLVYPQTTISATVGEAITPDVPVVSGTVNSFSVSPALPAGLNLNTSNGVISGTPTAVAPQANYTVTAMNSGGNTTAVLSISVTQAPHVLLNLGETGDIVALRMAGNRVLSADQNGYWALWDYASGARIAGGGGSQPEPRGQGPIAKPVDMAGSTVVLAGANNLRVLSSADGSLLSVIAFPGVDVPTSSGMPWWQLASDGSYICVGSPSGLFVYNTAGQLIASKQGDYAKAQVFAAPGKVMVAKGPAGQNVIETLSIATGASSVSQSFSGTFNAWFVDGSHFLSNLNDTVWVYSDAAAQQDIVNLPLSCLGGEGNWFWAYDLNGACPYESGNANLPLSVYAIGSTSPAFTANTGGQDNVFVSAGTIGLLDILSAKLTLVDLSGTTPTQKTYNTPIASLTAYAANSPSQWVAGNDDGAVLDGASLSGTPRYFGYGAALSISGAANSAAISTGIGKILIMDPYSRTEQESIDFPSSKVMLSSDGSLLAALSNVSNYSDTGKYYAGTQDETIDIFSLPAGSLVDSFPDSYQSNSYPQTQVYDFTLAASGTTIGRVTDTYTLDSATGSPVAGPVTRTVTPLNGSPVLWTDEDTSGSPPTEFDPILLSPDGTLIADSVGGNNPGDSSSIIQNGKLRATVAGTALGWIDNNRLLVNQFTAVSNCTVPLNACPPNYNAAIYSSAGVQLATPPVPQLKSIQPVNSDWVYSPYDNAIYSLTSGQAVWTGSFPSTGNYSSGTSFLPLGAVAGSYIVYVSGPNVVVESY